MNFDFTFYNPTIIHFGKNSLNALHEELKKYGQNVLLVYGGGSIKQIGVYDKVVKILNDERKKYF